MANSDANNEHGSIHTSVDGHVLVAEIDRRNKRNAFTPEMLRALSSAYDTLEGNAELRCALVVAAGDHFTAGLDLLAMAPVFAAGDNPIPEGSVNPWGTVGRRRTKPVVVGVQGKCLTLGIELILAADVGIAASDASFAQIEVQRGIMPFGGATTRFVRTCGWGHTMRYILTGDSFDATEARRIGLVQEVVSPAELRAHALAVAQRIAAQAPLGVQATLRNAFLAIDEGFTAAHAALNPSLLALTRTEDAAEGMQSFVERRAANFRGR